MSSRKKPKRVARLEGLYFRGKYWWFQPPSVRGTRPKPFSLKVEDEHAAIAAVLEWRRKPELQVVDFWDAEVDRYIAECLEDRKLSPYVAPSRRYVLKLLGRVAGLKNPSELSVASLQAWYDGYAKSSDYAPRTAEEYLNAVNSFFVWLLENHKVAANPVTKVRTVRVMKVARKEFVDRLTVRRLLAAARLETRLAKKAAARFHANERVIGDPQSAESAVRVVRQACEMEMVLYMGYDAGLRKNEIIHAMPDWFSATRRSVNVSKTPFFEPKVRQERTVPITNRFRRFLNREYPKNLPGPWVTNPDIKPAEGKDYRWEPETKHRNFMKRWDILTVRGKRPTIHTARHSFASNRLIMKQDPFRVAEWLGDTMEILQFHYGHLMADDPEVNVGV